MSNEIYNFAKSTPGKLFIGGVGSLTLVGVLHDGPDAAKGDQPGQSIGCGDRAELELKQDEPLKKVGLKGRLPGQGRWDHEEPGRGILAAVLDENAVRVSVSDLRKIGNTVDLTDPSEFGTLRGKTVYAQDGNKLFGSPALGVKNSERDMRVVSEVTGRTGENAKAIVEVEVHCYDDRDR